MPTIASSRTGYVAAVLASACFGVACSTVFEPARDLGEFEERAT